MNRRFTILTRMPIRPTKRGLMIDLVYEPIRDPVVIKIESGTLIYCPTRRLRLRVGREYWKWLLAQCWLEYREKDRPNCCAIVSGCGGS